MLLLLTFQDYVVSSYLVLDYLISMILFSREYNIIIYAVRVFQRNWITIGVRVYFAALVVGSL